MRLLITTQKVDSSDSNLGFFVRWIEEFAKHSASVVVICLEEGKHELPQNVRVLSLGKKKHNFQFSILNFQSIFNVQIFKTFRYALRFLKYLWQKRREYDAVFVHMNPEYVMLGGALWRLFGKKIGFWYTHKSKRLLCLALPFVHFVFTPSSGSFPLRTKKERIVGHGIDTELFSPRPYSQKRDGPPIILSDTRLTPSKRVEQTLELSRELLARRVAHAVHILGAPITREDEDYEKRLKEKARTEKLPAVFIGGVSFRRVPDYYAKADLFINHANVGALNKTVLQAMSMNIPVLTSNESYRGILPDADIVPPDIGTFAQRIQERLSAPRPAIYRTRIIREHSLQALIPKILHLYG